MQYANLLGDLPGADDLESFATKLHDCLQASDFERRESSNYVGGDYFRYRTGSMMFNVSLSDEDHDDLPYWIHVTDGDLAADTFASELENLVRAKILPAGFRLARFENFGKKNETRIDL